MQPFPPDKAYGELVINGVSAHTYAWLVLDVRPLYLPATYRGDNALIPHLRGRRAKPYRIDEGAFDLPMYLTGACDLDGMETEDRFQGLLDNLAYLTEAWLTPPPSGVLPATLTDPAGNQFTADVQVRGIEQADDFQEPFLKHALLHLRVPDGYFAGSESS